MIQIRSSAEIASIARAGDVVASVLDTLLAAASPGVPTIDLDTLARAMLRDASATPLFPGFVPVGRAGGPGFPCAICVCVNDEVTHGVPSPRVLEAGDLVCIDLGASVDGWCADASRARVVGDVAGASQAEGVSSAIKTVASSVEADTPGASDRASLIDARRHVLRTAHAATEVGIAAMGPGVRWSSVADAIRACAERGGCGVVGGFSGHGIGRALHEPPRAPMFLGPREDFVLRAGMVLTVEPIVVGRAKSEAAGAGASARADGVGRGRPVWLVARADGWTIATADGADACQIEHTVAVVEGGVRVLTRRETGARAT